MPPLPKVHCSCPHKGKFAHLMKGTQCRLCKRGITDLSAMEPEERDAFLSACDTELCISYGAAARSVLGAMAMSTLALATIAEA